MRHEFPFIWFLVAFAAYTVLLFLISWITGRKAGSNSFFSGGPSERGLAERKTSD